MDVAKPMTDEEWDSLLEELCNDEAMDDMNAIDFNPDFDFGNAEPLSDSDFQEYQPMGDYLFEQTAELDNTNAVPQLVPDNLAQQGPSLEEVFAAVEGLQKQIETLSRKIDRAWEYLEELQPWTSNISSDIDNLSHRIGKGLNQ
ncbi:MAG: hypothetical protein M1834_000927 [Cirrosporium novae-zelandiae]|nr:MAG: hypothetical protein M1834_000927 [Cirrosporium novae-zelandiae]